MTIKAKVAALERVASGANLLAQVRELTSKTLAILDKAERARDLKAALGAIREARGCLELLAKLLGELQQEGSTVDIALSAEWIELRTVLLKALGPYPEARLAVAEALRDVKA